uniref:Estradiol 17beta-dehydrogenase / testosterone 17beta-dehydrogenase n=2 Tax=Tetraselmis sp. GSL018 TaxID=582737 RepID=A0A061RCN9_9CHLO|mmetsp:Transcript_23697/g.56551  ORF Transcript_23697/g.56551 Transcript_23697/m.56551 type:complete len:311 (+) Transcript_23697:106-1038(+)|eukprot:CAMPEP_0177583862 /NCGR_PEP_ID=MMETSP0419_2-20121207/3562_1 /TAXON_ID=582737 /ORGANISM="Tetraselmis sp., Strain GSL018" /LENGTH=310 /DNA_ID=CAMNT_0019073309 /DNA_START=43 /DNA_END=975 /DNA_ORIENTATION=+
MASRLLKFVAAFSSLYGAVSLARRLFKRKLPVLRGAVLVTGASSGIGRNAAQTLARRGYIVFAGVRSQADATALKEECSNIRPVMLDVAVDDSVTDAAREVQAYLKAENLLLIAVVNNAGILGQMSALAVADLHVAHKVFEVNVFGILRVCQAFVPILVDAGPGARIVNISSIAAYTAVPGEAVYAASKHAVQALTQGYRLELHKYGIFCCSVNPGFVKTELANKSGDTALILEASPRSKERKMKQSIETGADPSVTSDAILHAISSPTPKTTYVVAIAAPGVPAWVVVFLRWLLPETLFDSLLLQGDNS